ESELSSDSLQRLEKNPLRILDSKDEGDRRVVAGAPSLKDCLNETSKKFFDEIVAGLDRMKIPYVVDPLLVRGLDYYCHTVFEFTTDSLGAQNAVCAGGRYDGLISDLGGPKTPGVGWAAGLDRLSMMIKEPTVTTKPVAVIPVGDDAEAAAFQLAQELRAAGVAVDMGYSGNMGKRMKRADKVGASHAIIVGSDELARGVAKVKDLALGSQREVDLKELAGLFKH
ncbi:MAG: His/Gly/Thr/Pro-type tRNA ligase C-terminal domain-containing protein, partial [Bdellovibrionota bacterium]